MTRSRLAMSQSAAYPLPPELPGGCRPARAAGPR
jgi:hypothetical protein